MRYDFILEDRAGYGTTIPPTIRVYSRALKVSVSGFHRHCRTLQRISPRQREQMELDALIRSIFHEHRGRYGHLRITAELHRRGYRIDRKRVLRRMQAMGLQARRRRKYRHTTCPDKRHVPSPNLLQQQFNEQRPRRKFVTDTTFVETDEGFVFLTVVLDLATRQVVGWSIADTLEQPGVARAIERALQWTLPEPGAILHSDRGAQFTSHLTRALLDQYDVVQSMSAAGNCYDNAPAESFFKTAKSEEVDWRHYRTRTEARNSLEDFILYYNNDRLHSSIGYLTPNECFYRKQCQSL